MIMMAPGEGSPQRRERTAAREHSVMPVGLPGPGRVPVGRGPRAGMVTRTARSASELREIQLIFFHPLSDGCDRLPAGEPQRLHPRAAAEDALQPSGRPGTVNVDRDRDRLKPFYARVPVGAAPAPGPPVSDVGQEGEHELLLNRREVRGVTRFLVRWRGHTSADDECLRE
jgi:hypothetical protein